MKVAVIANGEWDAEWGRQELAEFDFLICADGGGNHALQAGRLPDVLIGDLDSITPVNLERCQQKNVLIQQFPREKDKTDLELALEYAVSQLNLHSPTQELLSLWLYGATGGRVDHLLGNLALLLHYFKRGYRIYLKDPHHQIFLLQDRDVLKGHEGQELSIMPITEKARVTTEGLYYPLNGDVILKDSTRGISNVFLGEEAAVQVDEGIVMLILLT